MFDIKKFGGYLSRLRKKADMTQMELADQSERSCSGGRDIALGGIGFAPGDMYGVMGTPEKRGKP